MRSTPAAPRFSRTTCHARCSTSLRWMRSHSAWKRRFGDRLAARYSLTWSSRTLSCLAVLSPEGMRRSFRRHQTRIKQGPFPRPRLCCPSGCKRYYGPPATLPAERDFAGSPLIRAHRFPDSTSAGPGPARASPVPAPTLRPCRSLYPGRFLTAALQDLRGVHGLRRDFHGSAPPCPARTG